MENSSTTIRVHVIYLGVSGAPVSRTSAQVMSWQLILRDSPCFTEEQFTIGMVGGMPGHG